MAVVGNPVPRKNVADNSPALGNPLRTATSLCHVEWPTGRGHQNHWLLCVEKLFRNIFVVVERSITFTLFDYVFNWVVKFHARSIHKTFTRLIAWNEFTKPR